MFTVFEQPAEFYALSEELKETLTSLLGECGGAGIPFSARTDDILADSSSVQGRIFAIDEGFARFEVENRLLYLIEPGEIIGLGLPRTLPFRIVADSPVAGRTFDGRALIERVTSSPQLSLKLFDAQALMLECLTSLLHRSTGEDFGLTADRRYYRPGDPIIIQETLPSEVYTMLYGKGDVFVGSVQVGTVLPGEIFGAMSASTDTRRSASVIAHSECIVSVVPKELFLNLIKTHPTTVHKLIEDMSRVVISQNEKIIDMTN